MGNCKNVWFVAIAGAVLLFGISFADSGGDYGDVLVDEVLAVEDDYTLRCTIGQWPAVIGEDIPVRIDGVESLGIYDIHPQRLAEVKEHIGLFLDQQVGQAEVVVLRGIRRGEDFRLVARVEVDGVDLAKLLVAERLARKGSVREDQEPAREVEAPGQEQEEREDSKPAQVSPLQQPQEASPVEQERETSSPEPTQPGQEQVEYVASKSSRIFHRSDCSYARTIDEKNRVHFQSRQEAIDSGRRPCRKCEP